jgi:hypothetical protein
MAVARIEIPRTGGVAMITGNTLFDAALEAEQKQALYILEVTRYGTRISSFLPIVLPPPIATFDTSYGTIGFTHSSPLGNWHWAAMWYGFATPTLPNDAVVQKIYAVIRMARNIDGGDGCAEAFVAAGTALNPWSLSPSGVDLISNPLRQVDFAGVFYADMSETDLAFLATAEIYASFTQSASYDIMGDILNVSGLGFAVYYTSAAPIPDTSDSPLPVPIPAGQGVAWSYAYSAVARPGEVGAANGMATASAGPPTIPTDDLLPYMIIPTGEGQTINPLDGRSSISQLEVDAIDPGNELKLLIVNHELLGEKVRFLMGFPGMDRTSFVTLHTLQLTGVDCESNGLLRFTAADLQINAKQNLWVNGGPSIHIADPTTPPALAVFGAAGTATATYALVGHDQNGGSTLPTSFTTITNAPNTLSNTNYVEITWPAVEGIYDWDILKGNSTTSLAVHQRSVAAGATSITFDDIGQSTSSYVTPLVNTTEWLPGDPEPPVEPVGNTWSANEFECSDKNPRYVFGNPIDIALAAYQNELGIGQVSSNPASWQIFVPGSDSTLINPNPYLDVPAYLTLRDTEFSGDRFEFKITSPETSGKSWIEDQINKPLGLYTVILASGMLSPRSFKSPVSLASAVPIDATGIEGIPQSEVLPIVNQVVVTLGSNNAKEGGDQPSFQFDQSVSQARFRTTYQQSISCDGLRLPYGGYGRAFLLAMRTFQWYAFGTRLYTIKTHYRYAKMEISDYFLLSHPLLVDLLPGSPSAGQRGLVNVPCLIIDKQPDYAGGTFTFKVMDTRFMALTTPYDIVPNGTVPVWASASTAQKAKYMWMSSGAPPVYSDSTPGHGIF